MIQKLQFLINISAPILVLWIVGTNLFPVKLAEAAGSYYSVIHTRSDSTLGAVAQEEYEVGVLKTSDMSCGITYSNYRTAPFISCISLR